MSDKFRKVIPIKITFADGEAPTSAKLNAGFNQVRNGTALLEKAIGDPWGQSGDTLLDTTPTQLPNLARVIGELKYLNPIVYRLKNTFVFIDHVGAKWEGKTEGYLVYPTSAVAPIGGVWATSVANEYDVDSTGDYWIDTSTGRFRTFDPIAGGNILAYTVDLTDANSSYPHYDQVLPSLIPDPRQATFTSLRVEDESGIGNGPFNIHLPPRRPLTLGSTDFASDNIRPERYPGSEDEVSVNYATTITGDKKYWQYATSGLDHEHYRYQFPKEIEDYLDLNPAVGTELPQGFMYLWDTNTDTLIEDVRFFVADNARNWVLEVTSDTFDFDTVATSNELEASYDSGLVLICPGASLTRSIWQLASAFHSHNHDKSINSDGAISHSSLNNVNPPTDIFADHNGRYPTGLNAWLPSRWANDEHTSLLSRAGSQTISARKRDSYNNAMLGHLLLANQSSSNYLDASLPNESYRLYFGDVTGPYIHGTDPHEITISGVLVAANNFIHLKTAAITNFNASIFDTGGFFPDAAGVDFWVAAYDTDGNILVGGGGYNEDFDSALFQRMELSWDAVPGADHYIAFYTGGLTRQSPALYTTSTTLTYSGESAGVTPVATGSFAAHSFTSTNAISNTVLTANQGIVALGSAVNGSAVTGTGQGSGSGIRGYGGSTNSSTGVYGISTATNGTGVTGYASGTGYGVRGLASGTAWSIGVYGGTNAGVVQVDTYGVYGIGHRGGAGVYGIGDQNTVSGIGNGVYGESGAAGGVGVYGKGAAVTDIVGVYGLGGSDGGTGVEGQGGASSGTGVIGTGGATTGVGVKGIGIGDHPDFEAAGSGAILLTPRASPPSYATKGMIYMDTDNSLYVYNGSSWKEIAVI